MGLKNTILLSLFFVALVAKKGLAAQHVVGGSQGWEQSTDLNSWASSQKFKVGDQLVFKYSSMHSVVELPNESAFKNCDLGSALDTKKGGNDVVKLNKAGTRYFACGTLGHCDGGMKVKITTVAAGSNTASSPASSSSSDDDDSSSDASTTTSTTTISAASANFNSFNSFVAMTAVSALVLVYVF
ncbi:PREDICTED: basic blue protein [Fragaria vesca subsp. vesca]|uniref:basic blue protein n=1 Tax=Fragaria vesca subsp. vesca TaxID=101020 RepID=UPI0002C34E74|nr:PREDICTED: basic blue protein [Fragaria vesca subsp. vesca]